MSMHAIDCVLCCSRSYAFAVAAQGPASSDAARPASAIDAVLEAARREQAVVKRRQATALNLVVLGEVLRILRRPVYALALRQ